MSEPTAMEQYLELKGKLEAESKARKESEVMLSSRIEQLDRALRVGGYRFIGAPSKYCSNKSALDRGAKREGQRRFISQVLEKMGRSPAEAVEMMGRAEKWYGLGESCVLVKFPLLTDREFVIKNRASLRGFSIDGNKVCVFDDESKAQKLERENGARLVGRATKLGMLNSRNLHAGFVMLEGKKLSYGEALKIVEGKEGKEPKDNGNGKRKAGGDGSGEPSNKKST